MPDPCRAKFSATVYCQRRGHEYPASKHRAQVTGEGSIGVLRW